jgi:hypothetical protein
MEDNEKARKNAYKYKCELCDVLCSQKSDYDRHLLTRKHRKLMEDNEKARKNGEKSASSFKCESCDVICIKKSDFDRHLLTQKHQRIADDNKKMPDGNIKMPNDNKKMPNDNKKMPDDNIKMPDDNIKMQKDSEKCQTIISCHCGKIYKYKSGLCKHKKICKIIERPNNNLYEISMDSLTNAVVSSYANTHIIVPPYNPHPEIQPSESTKLILELMRDKEEFKNLLIEQNKIMLELVQKTQTITTYNTNSNNKQFNIQFFLNEQCKNAINLSDFVENLQLNFDDLENVADKGYVDGITQIFMNGLKELDIYTRPVHCTDVKRETVHVRENNIWMKDTPDQAKIKAAIRRIAFRNVQQISKWNKEHPDYKVLDSNDFNRSFQIMKQSLGNTIPGGVEKNNDKIAKNLLKAVYLDKQDPTLLCA